MKRLLSLILTLSLLLAPVVPFTALAAESQEGGAAVYPDLTESEYDSLYVSEGLVFMMDFYRTNSHWRGDTVYTAPIGPSENTAYWYDADKDGIKEDGETVDLTQAKNRATWRVLIKRGTAYSYYEPTAAVLYNGVSSPVTEYATKDLASEAATAAKAAINAAIAAHNAKPENAANQLISSNYECIPWQGASNALLAANTEWIRADRAFFASFTSKQEADGIYALSYAPSLSAGRADFDTNSKLLFTVATVGDGYALMRNDYHSSGGFLLTRVTGKLEDTTSLQIVTLLGENASSPFILYGNSRLTLSPAGENALKPTGFASNSAFKLNDGVAFPSAGSIATDRVQDLTYTIAGARGTAPYPATFSLKTHTDTLLSVAGSYTPGDTNYFGWSGTAKSARVYAVRNYYEPLSAADLQRNHLADLCKFFRLDITPLMSGEVGERTLSASAPVLATVAARMAGYTLADDRATVAAALAEVIDDLTLKGEGDAFLLFSAAVADGTVDATKVYALPDEHHARIYTAYKAFADANPTADGAARQAAVDAAVTAVLTDPLLPYAAYHGKPIALTPAAFFAANPAKTEAAKNFSALATAAGLDMAPLADLSPVVCEYIYSEFTDASPLVFHHAAILQARLAERTAYLAEFYFGDGLVADIIAFEGYQFRLVGASAYRAVFSVDTALIALLEEHGYTVTIGMTHKVKNTAGEPTVKEVYRDGAFVDELLTVDGKSCAVYEFYTEEKIKIGLYTAYVTLTREGNEDIEFVLTPESDLLPQGAKMKDLADILRKRGVVSTNIQRFLEESRAGILPTVFIGGQNLSDFAAISDGESAEVCALYLNALKDVTKATYRTVTAEEAEGMSTGLVVFEKGDAPAIALRNGNVVFTYTDDLDATAAAFAAALAKPEEGYPTHAFEDEDPLPVCLLYENHLLTAGE